MTREDLIKTVELTDDKYIAEAAVPPKKRGIFGFQGAKAVFAAAACLAVFLFAGVMLRNAAAPKYTPAPTTEGLSVSGTEEVTTAANDPSTTEKESAATEKTTRHTETTADSYDEPTEAPSAVMTEITTEPFTDEPSGEVAEPTKTTDSPTAPAQPPTDAPETQPDPPSETPTEPSSYKTLAEIIEEMGIFDASLAGEGELPEAPEQPQGTPPTVVTELTAEELKNLPGFVLPESITPPDGFTLAEFFAASYEQDDKTAVSAQYIFSSESGAITVMAVKRGGLTLPESAKELAAETVNGATVYFADNSPYKTPEEANEIFAVFMTNGIFYAVFGSGDTLTPEKLTLFISSFLKA